MKTPTFEELLAEARRLREEICAKLDAMTAQLEAFGARQHLLADALGAQTEVFKGVAETQKATDVPATPPLPNLRKKTGEPTAGPPTAPTKLDAEYCARCGHSREFHTEEIIPPGQYGKGGRCGWWKDPMFSPTEDCSCSRFQERPRGG